jgi:hypothetical protein
MSANYVYYEDGSLRKVDDLIDSKFDRLNTYDHLGRPETAKSGEEARGGTPTGTQLGDVPYRQSYQYNTFGNLTERNNLHWGTNNFDLDYSYQNNRITNSGYQYDADGREIMGFNTQGTYDAAGQVVVYHTWSAAPSEREIRRYYNGYGREEKRKTKDYVEDGNGNWSWVESSPTYYIRSSVLGGEVVTDVSPEGHKMRTYVRAGDATIAWQNGSSSTGTVIFQHQDVSGLSYRTSDTSGVLNFNEGYEGGPAELDPFGGNGGKTSPYIAITVPPEPCVGCGLINTEMPFYISGQQLKTELDGMEVPVSMAIAALQNGTAYQCPNNQCSVAVRYNGVLAIAYYTVYEDGYAGYVPNNARYKGNGLIEPSNITKGKPKLITKPRTSPRDTNISKLNGVSGSAETDLGLSADKYPWYLPNYKLDENETKNIRKNVSELLGGEGCATFIKNLLEVASLVNKPNSLGGNTPPNTIVSSDVLGIFDTVNAMGGFMRAPLGGVSSIRGNFSDGDATVWLGGRSIATGLPANAIKVFEIGEAQITIHELLHFNFDDDALANAVAFIKGESRTKGMSTSTYWNNELKAHCK